MIEHNPYLPPLLIAGAGGHAKVVVDAIRRAASGAIHQDILIIDDNLVLEDAELLGLSVTNKLPDDAEVFGFHVAIGNNALREIKFTTLGKVLMPVSVIHPNACVSESVVLESGSFVAAHAVIGPQAFLGMGCIVNHGAIVDHDCVLDSFCHVAPNATLAGNVRLGKRVFVGAGANILPGIVIGDDCVIGAGAVVLDDFGGGTTLVGVPARAIEGG